jgi:hypothetical protein
VRTVFVIGPDKKIKLMLSDPMSTGRNFDEGLRVLGRGSEAEVPGRLDRAQAVSAHRPPAEISPGAPIVTGLSGCGKTEEDVELPRSSSLRMRPVKPILDNQRHRTEFRFKNSIGELRSSEEETD